MKTIYLLRYSTTGFTDGIRLFSTRKAAQRGAQTAIDWGAWKATIYKTDEIYNHEINYIAIETYYNKEDKQ